MAYSLTGERPRAAAWPTRFLAFLPNWFARLRAAKRRRQSLSALLELDDYRLWDLGVTRNDIARALNSPDFNMAAARDWQHALDVWPPR